MDMYGSSTTSKEHIKGVSSNPISPNFCHIPQKIDKRCILEVKFQQGYRLVPLKMDMYGSSMTAKEHIEGGFITSYHPKFLPYTSQD